MLKYEIIPNKSVGRIVFGTERDKVRKILPGFQNEFKKSLFSKSTTDDFGYCHVFYDKRNECNAVEFFGDIEIIYKKKSLFGLAKEEIIDMFPVLNIHSFLLWM